jgi:dolichyl-diphosphooligosaccharide---protein glycosyltransferase
LKAKLKKSEVKKKVPWIIPLLVVLSIGNMCLYYVMHSTWVAAEAYSSPTVILATNREGGRRGLIDDYREAYSWLRQNTAEDAKIMSWWDYGYQITGMANRTVLVDNNTWNNTHIATVGRVFLFKT